jgi:hypothetical protein
MQLHSILLILFHLVALSLLVYMQLHSIPLFLCYLVLLMHNYFLGLVSRRPGPSREPSQLWLQAPSPRSTSLLRPFTAAASAILAAALATGVGVSRHLYALTQGCSLAPHCLLLHIEVCILLLRWPSLATHCVLAAPSLHCGRGQAARHGFSAGLATPLMCK